MQKPVKKNVDKKSNDSFPKNLKKKTSKQAYSKFGKKRSPFKHISKKTFRKALKKKKIGRVFKRFKVFLKKRFLRLDIRVAQNNVFCSLNKISPNITVIDPNTTIPKNILLSLKKNVYNEVLLSASSGNYKINLSRKTIRFQARAVLEAFLENIRELKIPVTKPLVVKIIGPLSVKRNLLKALSRLFLKKLKKKGTLLIYVEPKKVFNGCKARKKSKKKRKNFIIYK